MDSIIFAFFLGGTSAVLYQVIFKKSLLNVKRMPVEKMLLLIPILFFGYLFSNISVMYFCVGTLVVEAMIFCYFDRKLWVPVMFNAVLLFSMALIAYPILWRLYPETLPQSYNYARLSGVMLFSIPIEELLFYAGVGSFWAILYEVIGKAGLGKRLAFFYE